MTNHVACCCLFHIASYSKSNKIVKHKIAQTKAVALCACVCVPHVETTMRYKTKTKNIYRCDKNLI